MHKILVVPMCLETKLNMLEHELNKFTLLLSKQGQPPTRANDDRVFPCAV